MIRILRLVLLLCGLGLLALDAHAAKPMVASGWGHTVALNNDGRVYAWGDDTYGQLGLGRTVMATAPQAVPGLNLGQGGAKSRIAAGATYSVTVKSDGSVWAWGSNSYGRLGDGTKTQRSSPVQVPGLTGVVAVAAGASHTLAVKSDGSVWAWGGNYYGELGDGTTWPRSSPKQVPGFTGVVAVAIGGEDGVISIALKSDGSVWTWGSNDGGRLGDGTTMDRSSPVQVLGLSGVVAIAAGGHFAYTLALKSDGSVWAWGTNQSGELGDGTTNFRSYPKPVPGLTGVVALAAGDGNSVALKSDGSVWAWGANWYGQLGDGTTTDRSTPVQVQGLTGVVAVAAGGYHTIALKSDGSVWAWGYNRDGQLGDDTTTNRSSPVQVPGFSGVVAVATGSYFSGASAHTLALKSDGSIWAWGDNTSGQLGDGAMMYRSSPVLVPGLTGIKVLAAGDYNTLALKSDGTVWAWGLSSTTPMQLPGLNGVVAVATKDFSNFALKSDGSVWALGRNQYGQLGDGSLIDRSMPVPVLGLTGVQTGVVGVLTGVVAVAAAGTHTLALKSDGSVWAWGNNDTGQLGDGIGDGTTGYRRSFAKPVPGLTGVVAVVAACSYLCDYDFGIKRGYSFALKSDGSVWAWGYNGEGQLGDGTTTNRSSPVQVPGISGVVAVASGRTHTLGLKSDGTVVAWGGNGYGQLGDGTRNDRLTPVQVLGLTEVAMVAAYSCRDYTGHSFAVKSDGSVWAWGDNQYGQLGIDMQRVYSLYLPSPTQVQGLSGVASVANVCFHTVALKSDGSLWSWGNNSSGQLGDGSYASRTTYVGVLNDTLSGFLDLDPTVANLPVPADKIPPFFLAASKSGDLNSLALSARVRLAPVNIGSNTLAKANRFAAGCGSGGTCQMYVAAHAPAGGKTPVCAPVSASATDSWWSPDIQRNWNGLAWPLPAFQSNVAPGQDQIVQVDILNNCNLTGQTGTEFYLGYGENADEMLNAGRYRVILTVPDK